MTDVQTPEITVQPDQLAEVVGDVIDRRMDDLHIPGVAFVLVKDGKVVLKQGCGHANLEKQTLVDPDTTMFRVASVSKTFTMTAVMQLVERGAIDLDAETNQYLTEFEIINPFDSPQRIRHLLTHTDGFEERLTGLIVDSWEDMAALGDTLREYVQPLYTAPGEVISYGSYGTALLSYLVQEVSGQRFEDYIAEHIFEPLDMTSSTMWQNFTPEQLDRLAIVYGYHKGSYVASPPTILATAGTGGSSTTAADMANFLIALLQNGRYNDGRIISPETSDLMFSQQFCAHPGLPGVTYGFFEHVENGVRALIRDGSGLRINSRIVLWPEHDMGFFAVSNKSSSVLNIELTTALCDHLFSVDEVGPVQQPEVQIEGIDRYVGQYRDAQYARHSINKPYSYWGGVVKVEKGEEETTLSFSPGPFGDPYSEIRGTTTWAPIDDLLWQRADGKGRFAFDTNDRGEPDTLYSGVFYHSTYRKLAWYETIRFHLRVMGVFALALAAGLAGAVAGAMPALSRVLLGGSCLINLAFLIAIIPSLYVIGARDGWPPIFLNRPRAPVLRMVLALPFIGLALTVGLVVALLAIPPDGAWAARSLVLAVAIVIISFIYYWYLRFWRVFTLSIR